jgi:hypothetical protein
MPKLNIYVDDDLAKRIKEYNLPLSQICQNALWQAVEETETAVCGYDCRQPAVFFIQGEGGSVYACRKHLTTLLTEGISTVRSI